MEPNPLTCFHCGSKEVRTIGFYNLNDIIEVEEIRCVKCKRTSKFPLRNQIKQLFALPFPRNTVELS